jgi:ribosomal protein L37AE/L43A
MHMRRLAAGQGRGSSLSCALVNSATTLMKARWKTPTMAESRFNEAINRPTACPFCQGKRVDTLAKTITVATLWRCRECEATWTIASRAASTARSPFTL